MAERGGQRWAFAVCPRGRTVHTRIWQDADEGKTSDGGRGCEVRALVSPCRGVVSWLPVSANWTQRHGENFKPRATRTAPRGRVRRVAPGARATRLGRSWRDPVSPEGDPPVREPGAACLRLPLPLSCWDPAPAPAARPSQLPAHFAPYDPLIARRPCVRSSAAAARALCPPAEQRSQAPSMERSRM